MTSVSSIDYSKYYQDKGENYSAKEAMKVAQDLGLYGGANYGQTASGLDCIVNGGKQFGGEATHYTVDGEEMARADAMADSFDSVLDVYIMEKVDEFIRTECGGDSSYWWDGRGFLTDEKKALLLEKYNIQVNQIDDRTFTFSLVDDEGNVIKDAEGNEGSCMWGDWVIPDGFAQDSELNLSSMLDLMGYDCVSAADFTKDELSAMVDDIDSQLTQFNSTHQDTDFLKHSKQNANEYIMGKYTGSSSSESIVGNGTRRTDANSDILDMTDYIWKYYVNDYNPLGKEEVTKEQENGFYKLMGYGERKAEESAEQKSDFEQLAIDLNEAISDYEQKFEELKAEDPSLLDSAVKEKLQKDFVERLASEFNIPEQELRALFDTNSNV